MRPVTDHAEIGIDFPEKAYMGTFGRTASFSVRAGTDGVEVKLVHSGTSKRAVDLHLHWFFFADLIDEIAAALEGRAGLVDEAHRTAVTDAAKRLTAALATPANPAEPDTPKPQR